MRVEAATRRHGRERRDRLAGRMFQPLAETFSNWPAHQ
jgi:hypothetical protein